MAVKRASRAPSRSRQTGSQTGRRTGEATDETNGDEEGLVGNLFDDMESDSIVIVHRYDAESARQVLMFKLIPEEATDTEIQKLAGGGKYATREQVRNEAGQLVWGRQRTVVIGGRPKEPQMPRSYEERQPASVNPAPEVGTTSDRKTTLDDVLTGGILRLFTTQADAAETQAKMFQSMAGRPQMDWTALIVALSPLFLKLLDRKDDGPNPMEMVTQIAEMVKSSSSPTTQFKDMLETVDSVFSIKEQAAGPPADPLTALAATLPQILEIVSAEQRNKGRMPTHDEVKRKLAAPSTQPPGGKMPVYQGLLRKFAPMLVRWAREGKDPGLMGEFLYNSIPEKYHGAVREFLLREDADNMVYQAVPDLREFPQWTQDCFGTLAEAFGIVEEETPEAEVDATFEVGEDGVGTEVVESATVEETTETVEE
jgi:hypothetical protein